jgi:hypothetical protein
MAEIDRISRGARCKCAEIALHHRQGVVCEEGRGGSIPLLLVGQRGNRGAQLVDGQVLVAAHRGDAIRNRWLTTAQGLQREGSWRYARLR